MGARVAVTTRVSSWHGCCYPRVRASFRVGSSGRQGNTSMNRHSLRFALLPALLAVAACHRATPTPIPHSPGDTSFLSQSPNGGMARSAAGGAAPGATGQTDNTNGGTTTTSRSIIEADIYKVVGNTLYVLNSYRGLQVIDVSDLTAPKLLTRVPIVGSPIDLYVVNNTAYVAVSDYFWYGWIDGPIAAGCVDAGGAIPYRGSQVWAIDVSQPASPKVLSRLPIDGDVDQTRIVGNVLYVESHHWAYWEWDVNDPTKNQDLTFVASFDISNPLAMKAVDRVDFPATGWTTHANITVDRITLAESGWDMNGGGSITNFQVINISDPAGKLALGTSFSVPGQIADRWSMDFDETTGLFRAVSEVGWNNGAALDIWSTPSPGLAVKLGHLDLNLPESLTTAAFDGNRAYLVTQHCVDPLWIVDTTNPAQPVVDSSLTIPGVLDFVEPRGNYMLALGHDSSTCHGLYGNGLAVSLFDVTNANAPSLVSQVSFGSGFNYVDANPDDYKKVFQVLDAMNLILVPYESWDDQNWTYNGGTQLIDFTPTSLTLRGFAPHAGAITRAFPVGNMLVALSDQSLQVLDPTNRDNPVEVSAIDLARPVSTLVAVNGYTVELSGDWMRGDTELVVTPANAPESASPVARVKVPAPYSGMYQDGNVLWILAHNWGNGTETAWLQGVDVSDPTHPTLRGRLDLDPTLVPYWGGGWWYWGYGDEAVLVNHALALHRMYYDNCWYGGCTQPADTITAIDLSNPDAPAIASSIVLPDSNWSWGLKAVGNYAWITHYEWVPDSNYSMVRYYLDRIDLTNPRSPVLLDKVNVPGVFFSASDDGNTIYTQEIAWSSDWSNVTTYLHQLALSPAGYARLTASAALAGYPGGASVNGGFAYAQTTTWNSSQSFTSLSAIDLANMAVTSSQAVGAQYSWLMKSEGGKLFLSAGWYDNGVLIYDLTTASQPAFQGYVRTEGYVEDVVVSGTTAYLPCGYYGVPMVDLTPGAPLPSL